MGRPVCDGGKVAHPSLALATIAARNHHRSLNQRGEYAMNSYAYRCPACRRWHLTHRPEWNGHANRLVLRAAARELQEWAMPRRP